MKNKIILGILTTSTLIFSNVALADITIKDINNNNLKIITPLQSKFYDGIPDILIATSVGDLDFLKKSVAQDPEIFRKYNQSNPEEIIGFNAKDLTTLEFVRYGDRSLFNRMAKNNRNIISSMLFNHWDELTHKKDIDYFNNFEKALPSLGIKLKDGDTLKKKDISSLTEMTLKALSRIDSNALNQKDIFGNTSLHYAVGRRIPILVKKMLEDSSFHAKASFNNYKETAAFMLIDNSCKIDDIEKKKSQEVLSIMLDARVSLFQKNISGFSFPALVYGLPNLTYLAEILDEKLSPMQKNIFQKEAQLVQEELKRGDKNKLYTSIQRNGYWTNKCKYFEDKATSKNL